MTRPAPLPLADIFLAVMLGGSITACDQYPRNPHVAGTSSTGGTGGGWGQGGSTAWYLDLHGGTTSDANHVIGLDPNGSATVVVDIPTTVPSGDALTLPRGMCLLPDGSLLVVSAFKDDTQILRYGVADVNGRRPFDSVFVHGGLANPSLQHPYEIEVGPDGNVYAANQDTQTITRYAGLHATTPGVPLPAPAGSDAALAGAGIGVIVPSAKMSANGLDTPRGITFGPDGLLYAVDRDARITAWDPSTGRQVRVVVDQADGVQKAIQAHFLAGTDTMLIGDRGAKTVWKTTSRGGAVQRFLPESVKIEEPSIVTSDSQWVYVGDRATKSIRRFHLGSGQPEPGTPWVEKLPDPPEFLIRASVGRPVRPGR